MESKTEPLSVKELKSEIDFCNDYYSNLLGYKPEQTELQIFPDKEWNSFCERSGLEKNSSGVYLPRNQTAFIDGKNQLTLFHEYFGHGLFCEQSLAGRKLVDLEKRLLDEEKEEFKEKKFTLEKLKEFRMKNKTFLNLDKFRKENLTQYELFAIWTEYLLSNNGLRKEFEKKYDSFGKEDREIIDGVINFSEQYGDLASFYAQGLAKRTTAGRVKKLLERIYGDKLQNVKFVSLYGSRKEFSDVDVFVVSENFKEITTDWLDVRVEKMSEFEKQVRSLDVSLVCPLFDAECILGDKEYFENIKNQFKESPITEETIRYNLKKSREQKELGLNYPKDSEGRIQGLAYSKSYLKNYLALKSGKKILTKEELLLSSQSENFIELKGGII